MLSAPLDLAELLARADALSGRTLDEIALVVGEPVRPRRGDKASQRPRQTYRKGRTGALIERALGASGGSAREVDFPHLGVELKTVPVTEQGKPKESTYVCTLPLANADHAEWATSWVREKLACVLWVPVFQREGASPIVSRPLLWSPSEEQEAVFKADFDEIVGLVGSGNIEALTARVGRFLQARPKAARASDRTVAFGPGDERILALPRGFYLRARFTEAILRDPLALPR